MSHSEQSLSSQSEKKENLNSLATNSISEKHSPKAFMRGNQSYFVCDHCGAEVEEQSATKITKGKQKDYVYCPKCTKELYPTYKKVAFYNPNPIMTNILREGLARYEKLR